METGSSRSRDNQEIDLPPGFRFHPTDEELITRYLSPKVVDNSFCALAIGEVDLNKVEPWDLPCKYSLCFSSVFHFSCVLASLVIMFYLV